MGKVGYLIFTLVMLACSNNSDRKHSSLVQSEATIHLDWRDSNFIDACIIRAAKIDTIKSKTGCSKTIKGYDRNQKIVFLKNIQYCMSDTRLQWQREIYWYKEKRSLEIALNGLKKVVEVKRGYSNP